MEDHCYERDSIYSFTGIKGYKGDLPCSLSLSLQFNTYLDRMRNMCKSSNRVGIALGQVKTTIMLSILVFAALGGAARAELPNDNRCFFQLNGQGATRGPVDQTRDGQNRVGSDLLLGSYTIDSNGGITDGRSRGCILACTLLR